MEDLTVQVGKLQRQVAHLRRHLLLAIVVLGSAPFILQYAARRDVLVGTGLILRDERGEVRFHVALQPKDTGIALYSQDGILRMIVSANPYGSELELRSEDGSPRVRLEGRKGGADLTLLQSLGNGENRKEAKPVVGLYASPDNARLASMNAPAGLGGPGGRVLVAGGDGDVLFSAP